MIELGNGLLLEGGAFSIPRHKTPQYQARGGTQQRENGDYAEFNEAGLFVTDGVSSHRAAGIASGLTVLASTREALRLRIPEMPTDEAKNAVEEHVLPYADSVIDRYIREHDDVDRASTTLGALFVARECLIAATVGDTLTLGCSPSRDIEFAPMAREQNVQGALTNVLAGRGRPLPGQVVIDNETNEPLPPYLTHDQVRVVYPVEGDYYLIMTDGVTGSDGECSRFPLDSQYLLRSVMPHLAPTAVQAAINLVTLPYRVEQSGLMVPGYKGQMTDYRAPLDDASAGVIRVHAKQQ